MRLAVVDDSGVFRDALTRSLRESGAEVVLAAGSGEAFLQQWQDAALDAAIIDVAMPPTLTDEGVVLAREIKATRPQVAVLLLSAHAATPQAISLLTEIDTGIGYLSKNEVADVAELYRQLERVLAGECVVDPSLVRRLLRAQAREDALARLTDSERLVLGLMAEGYSNAGIGAQLHLAERTVEDHVGRVFTKLDIGSRSDRSENRRVLAVLTWLRLTQPT